MQRVVLGGLVGVLASAIWASSGAAASVPAPDRLVVATTVAPITSIVSNIVGDRVDVVGIVPEGTNSHTFEPRPSDAELLSNADILFVNGLGLEEPTVGLADATMAEGSEIVELGTTTISEDEYLYDFSFPESGGLPNPHLWTDPLLVQSYAEIIAAEMSELDPANADYFTENLAQFTAVIDELDEAMRIDFETIPSRELLTYHDAYAYFAADYGWTVLGAIQVADFGEPTPGEVADLIEQIRAQEVPAIFGSEVFPSPILEQIAEESGAEYVDDLRDDDLPGAPGDAEHSWQGLMLFNYITMTEALGGEAVQLRAIEVRSVAPDEADYPQ